MLAKIFGVCVALLIIFVGIPSFAIGLVIWWNFVHYIFFEPSRNELCDVWEKVKEVMRKFAERLRELFGSLSKVVEPGKPIKVTDY